MFSLPVNLDIHNVKKVYDDLLETVEQNIDSGEKKIVLDADNVEDVDAAGIQLLLALKQTCKKEKIEFKIKNIGETCKRLFLLSGVNFYKEG